MKRIRLSEIECYPSIFVAGRFTECIMIGVLGARAYDLGVICRVDDLNGLVAIFRL